MQARATCASCVGGCMAGQGGPSIMKVRYSTYTMSSILWGMILIKRNAQGCRGTQVGYGEAHVARKPGPSPGPLATHH